MAAQEPLRERRRKKPQKGTLIKGKTERLPIQIIQSPVFEEHVRTLMRGRSGIYLLSNQERPIPEGYRNAADRSAQSSGKRPGG